MSNLNHATQILAVLRPFAATFPADGHPSVGTLFGRMRVIRADHPEKQRPDRGVPFALQFALTKTRCVAGMSLAPPIDPGVPYRVTSYGYALDPEPDAPGVVYARASALLAAVGCYPRGHEPWNLPETCGTCGGSSRNHEGLPGECGGCDGCGIIQQGHPLCPLCAGSGWQTGSAKPKVARRVDIRRDGGLLRDPPVPRCWCRPELPDPRVELTEGERRFWTPAGPVLWTLERRNGVARYDMMGEG